MYGFVVLCFVVVIWSVIGGSNKSFYPCPSGLPRFISHYPTAGTSKIVSQENGFKHNLLINSIYNQFQNVAKCVSQASKYLWICWTLSCFTIKGVALGKAKHISDWKLTKKYFISPVQYFKCHADHWPLRKGTQQFQDVMILALSSAYKVKWDLSSAGEMGSGTHFTKFFHHDSKSMEIS